MKQNKKNLIYCLSLSISLATSLSFAQPEQKQINKKPECIISENAQLDVDTSYRQSIFTAFSVKSYKTIKFRATDKSENEIISISAEHNSENSLGRKYNPINILFGALGAAIGGAIGAVQCPFKEGTCYKYIEQSADIGANTTSFIPETIFSNLFGWTSLAFAVGASRYMYLTYDFPVDELLKQYPKCEVNQSMTTIVQPGQRLQPGKYILAEESAVDTAESHVDGISFEISYAAGLYQGQHFGTFKSLQSEIEINNQGQLVLAKLRVPVRDLSMDGSDSPLKDCHVHQALSLDYSKGSKSAYPEEDTCDDKGLLATEGPNAPRFSDIKVSFVRFLEGDIANLESGSNYKRSALFTFSIHGVTKTEKVDLEIIPLSYDMVRIKSIQPFAIKLADYQIVVRKPFPFMDVGSVAKVDLNLLLRLSN